MTRPERDGGSAIVEFVWLAVLVMLPLGYVMLTAVSIQRAAFGATAAVRDGARAYATAGSDAVGERRAEQAMSLAMHDQGLRWSAGNERVVACGDCSYEPGSQFTVELKRRVALPFVPSWLCGRVCVAAITVTASHTEQLSCFGGTGVADPGAGC
jgi:hypothetical protein